MFSYSEHNKNFKQIGVLFPQFLKWFRRVVIVFKFCTTDYVFLNTYVTYLRIPKYLFFDSIK